MALQIRRGTNAQRLLYTPLVGELVFVTDYTTADVDPIYVGDGITLGGVAVGQNAVLSGNMEGDVNLNNNDIIGSGNIAFTGNINNVGTVTTKKITVTGDGGVAIVSTGSITNTGNVNVSGNIVSSGTIQAVTTESDLVGNVLSSDSTQILVNATTNAFSGDSLTLTDGDSSVTFNANGLLYSASDEFDNFNIGTEDQPVTFTQYEQQPWVHYGRITLDGDGNLTVPGTHSYVIYRGTLASPLNIQTNDKIGGFFYRSYNNKVGGGDAVQGFAGAFGFIAEDQTDAPSGVVPATFVVGSGVSATNAFFDTNTPTSGLNDILKYTSKGVLGVTAINLRAIGNADRTALTPFVDEGTIIYNYEATDLSGAPLGQGALQIRIGSGSGGVWYNIALSGASNLP
jgi:hypothetical protein